MLKIHTLAFGLALTVAPPLAAQLDPFSWDNATEFSYVSTAGNASSNTLGLKSTLTGSGEGTFKLEVGGIRASSNFTTRTATGTIDDFVVNEETRTEQSAANYFARTRYDHTLGSIFTFGGGGWERNTFSGVNNRFSLVAGLGKTWIEGDDGLFKTDLGATYTVQKDVEPDPTRSEGFVGLRATIQAEHALTETTDLATTLVLDENLYDTDNFRFDWVVSIGVVLTEGLAFKTSFQMLFDNDPALIGVPLLDGGGVPIGQVKIPSQKVDSFLTLSLVIQL
jgi:putative salt-induced outer membrane protein YdiY